MKTLEVLFTPADFAARVWSVEEAACELVRGRLQAMGPVTAASLAALLSLEVRSIDAALLALESEGFVLRGRFTDDATGDSSPVRRRKVITWH